MKYAFVFSLLALVLVADAVLLQGVGWVLLWPAGSFLLVAGAHAGLGPGVLGKQSDGRVTLWAVMLLFPYLLLTWGLWHMLRLLSREDCWNEVAPGLFLGRRAFPHELPNGVTLVVDVTSEFPAPRGIRNGREYICLPILDAESPDETGLRTLIERVAAWPDPVYVHCAQGHGRSALVMAGVLLLRGVARDPAEALQQLRTVRPGVWLKKSQRQLLSRLVSVPEVR